MAVAIWLTAGADGGGYVTIFAGPAAEARAKAYWTALQLGELDIIVAADVPPPT